MNILESVNMAVKTLTANKMRSALTMLGIIIGNASVIAMVGVGQGTLQPFAVSKTTRPTLPKVGRVVFNCHVCNAVKSTRMGATRSESAKLCCTHSCLSKEF